MENLLNVLNVLVASPQEKIWEGKAKAVSSINLEGPFDILPFHATFVTIVDGNPIKVLTENGKTEEFKFDRCVIYNRNNSVSVYTQV